MLRMLRSCSTLRGKIFTSGLIALALIASALLLCGQSTIFIVKFSLYLFFSLGLIMLRGNLRLVVWSIVLTLLLLEGILRGQAMYYACFYPEERGYGVIYQYDSVLGWKHKPNMKVVFSQLRDRIRARIQTNSRGLRDDEYAPAKPPGVFRIVMVGNSTLAGFEVDKKYVIDTQLEKLLNSDKNRRHCEVINCGVRGYGTDQSYLFLKSEGLLYHPDIVIYMYTGNDVDDNITIHDPNRQYGKSYFMEDAAGRINLKGVPVPREFKPGDKLLTTLNINDTKEAPRIGAAIPVREKAVPAHSKTLWKSIKEDGSHSALYCFIRGRLHSNPWLRNALLKINILELWHSRAGTTVENQRAAAQMSAAEEYKVRLLQKILALEKATVDSAGARFLVFEMTSGSGPLPLQPTKLHLLCRELGIGYIDPYRTFQEASNGRILFRYKNDGHWNRGGHALAAKIIYDYLIQNKLLDSDSK